MKQILLIATASLVMFACSKEESREIPGEQAPASGIVIDLATTNNIDTKRPVYSQDSLQAVDTVTIFVFKNNGTDYVYDQSFGVPGWTAGTAQKSYTIPSSSLAAGDYKFIATGREKSTGITLTLPVNGVTKFSDFSATVLTNDGANEIFAGNQQATVAANTGVRVKINMTRKVGGLLAYFVNIPSTYNGKTVVFLRVQLSQSSLNVNLTTGAGTNTGLPNNAVLVNFTGRATNANGTYVGNAAISGVAQLPNSQLNGAFLLPVTSTTMTVQLLDLLSIPVKTWSVASDGNLTFDVIANHFYSLGRKVKNGSTDAGTPGVPGDDDSAIDLLKDQEINITISPAWSSLHNLVLQ